VKGVKDDSFSRGRLKRYDATSEEAATKTNPGPPARRAPEKIQRERFLGALHHTPLE
jgi:hypothetical protein